MTREQNPIGKRILQRAPVRFLLGLALATLILFASEALLNLLPLDRWEEAFPVSSYPVFLPGEGALSGSFVTNQHFKKSMNFQVFARKKAPGVKRIFVLGGSAAMGWPGTDGSAFTGFLRRALEGAKPGEFEIVNVAGMSYASHRVLDVLYDIVDFQPDLVVIWCGNNEYVERNVLPASARHRRAALVNRLLRRSHVYRSVRLVLNKLTPSLFRRPEGVDLTDPRVSPQVRRESPARTPEVDKEVHRHYHENLAEMARLLRDRGIRGLFCAVPVNLAGWVPNGCLPGFSHLNDGESWRAEYESAEAAARKENFPEAARRFEKVIARAPGFAPAHYQQGEVLRRLGRYVEALREFQAACDEDCKPIRAFRSFNETIRSVATEHGFPVLDLPGVFLRYSGTNLVGLDLFFDYCHPNDTGHKLAAEALLGSIVSLIDPALPEAVLAGAIRDDPLAPQYQYPGEIAYSIGMTYDNNRDPAKAREYYQKTLDYNPGFPEALGNLGVLSYNEGDAVGAASYFVRALREDPGLPMALYCLGRIRLEAGALPQARELAARLLAQQPANPAGLELMGDVAAAAKDWPTAVANYEKTLQLVPGNGPVREKAAGASAALQMRK